MNPKIVPKSSAQVPRNSKKPSKYVPGHSRPLQQSSKSDPTLWPPTDSLPPMNVRNKLKFKCLQHKNGNFSFKNLPLFVSGCRWSEAPKLSARIRAESQVRTRCLSLHPPIPPPPTHLPQKGHRCVRRRVTRCGHFPATGSPVLRSWSAGTISMAAARWIDLFVRTPTPHLPPHPTPSASRPISSSTLTTRFGSLCVINGHFIYGTRPVKVNSINKKKDSNSSTWRSVLS